MQKTWTMVLYFLKVTDEAFSARGNLSISRFCVRQSKAKNKTNSYWCIFHQVLKKVSISAFWRQVQMSQKAYRHISYYIFKRWFLGAVMRCIPVSSIMPTFFELMLCLTTRPSSFAFLKLATQPQGKFRNPLQETESGWTAINCGSWTTDSNAHKSAPSSVKPMYVQLGDTT